MTFDFAPLYRNTVGFDHLAALLDSVATERQQPAFPPYNIELLEKDKYRITMAVAGFSEADITVESENNTLTVAANRPEKPDATKRSYLHQGIAERNFKRQFKLADHVKVVSASLANGLLHVELAREIPEAMKPRTIPVNGRSDGRNENVQPLLKSA
jgi:molecular chaperone IbpA